MKCTILKNEIVQKYHIATSQGYQISHTCTTRDMLSNRICQKFLFWHVAKIQNVQHSPTSTENNFRHDIYFDRFFDISAIPDVLAFKRFFYFVGFWGFAKLWPIQSNFILAQQATFLTFSPITQTGLSRFGQNLNTIQP